TSLPCSERQARRSFSTSSTISASHSTDPPGAFADHRDRPGVVRSTDSRWIMKRGRFSNSRQKAYSSALARITVTLRSTLTPASARGCAANEAWFEVVPERQQHTAEAQRTPRVRAH